MVGRADPYSKSCSMLCNMLSNHKVTTISHVFVPSLGNTMLQWDNNIIHVCFMCTSSIDITTVVITLLDTKCSTQTIRLIDPILISMKGQDRTVPS